MATIHPVILSGGAGTRLWPMSRTLYPKQLLPLAAEGSMLQETARRVAPGDGFAAPMVICNEAHRFIVAEQLRAASIAPAAIVLEPEGRNTAPAAAVAAELLAREDPGALMLVLPADHVIADEAAFAEAVGRAAGAAEAGALVTFGVAPSRPETGYGYIRRGAAMAAAGADGAFEVAEFVEKPDRATAESYLASGGDLWDSGMFLFRAERYRAELGRRRPEMVEACRRAVAGVEADMDFLRLEADAFRAAPADSIDFAVMEHTGDAAVVPAEMGWSDVGAWSALWEIGDKDANGNVVVGDVLTVDTHGAYIRSEAPLVAVIGLEDVVIVATEDAVLAAPRARVQEVRRLVDELKASGRPEPETHRTVYRPWGHYQTVDSGARFQVKRITVKPGAKLSLQKHAHRAEHWVVVRGTARVTRDDEIFDLEADQSAYIPLGAVHRLENPGAAPLELVEVQSGDYLGEDDIVRLEDTYGRS